MVTTRPPKTIVKPTALGPIANTDTKLLIYGLFQKGRVLAQDAGKGGTSAVQTARGGSGPGPSAATPYRPRILASLGEPSLRAPLLGSPIVGTDSDTVCQWLEKRPPEGQELGPGLPHRGGLARTGPGAPRPP